uniref:Uncharacterized protein n=1 Tax=Micrurus lemniscatus lemniscatus TaxID=129467 RepID=A0A2D4IHJ0_MICLE
MAGTWLVCGTEPFVPLEKGPFVLGLPSAALEKGQGPLSPGTLSGEPAFRLKRDPEGTYAIPGKRDLSLDCHLGQPVPWRGGAGTPHEVLLSPVIWNPIGHNP